MVENNKLRVAIDLPNTRRFSTGFYSLDEILGGGLVIGSIVEIFGEESDGKTTLGIQLLKQAQENGFKLLYIDAEHSVTREYLEQFLNLNDLYFLKPASAEEAFDAVREFFEKYSDVKNMIFIDSVPALIPERAVSDGSFKVAELALILSQYLPIILRKYYNSIVVFTNQVRDIIDMRFGRGGETTTGGRALRFYAGYRLKLDTIRLIFDSDKNQIGKVVKVEVIKNKFGKPFGSCFLDLYFGKGYSLNSDLLEFAINKKVIEVSGSWYKFEGQSVHGREEFLNRLNDKDFRDKLVDAISKI